VAPVEREELAEQGRTVEVGMVRPGVAEDVARLQEQAALAVSVAREAQVEPMVAMGLQAVVAGAYLVRRAVPVALEVRAARGLTVVAGMEQTEDVAAMVRFQAWAERVA
jgi:hypothetical protein